MIQNANKHTISKRLFNSVRYNNNTIVDTISDVTIHILEKDTAY